MRIRSTLVSIATIATTAALSAGPAVTASAAPTLTTPTTLAAVKAATAPSVATLNAKIAAKRALLASPYLTAALAELKAQDANRAAVLTAQRTAALAALAKAQAAVKTASAATRIKLAAAVAAVDTSLPVRVVFSSMALDVLAEDQPVAASATFTGTGVATYAAAQVTEITAILAGLAKPATNTAVVGLARRIDQLDLYLGDRAAVAAPAYSTLRKVPAWAAVLQGNLDDALTGVVGACGSADEASTATVADAVQAIGVVTTAATDGTSTVVGKVVAAQPVRLSTLSAQVTTIADDVADARVQATGVVLAAVRDLSATAATCSANPA